jgi:hypothetical protein
MVQCSRHVIPVAIRGRPHQPAGARSTHRAQRPRTPSADLPAARHHPHPINKQDGRPPLGTPNEEALPGIRAHGRAAALPARTRQRWRSGLPATSTLRMLSRLAGAAAMGRSARRAPSRVRAGPEARATRRLSFCAWRRRSRSPTRPRQETSRRTVVLARVACPDRHPEELVPNGRLLPKRTRRVRSRRSSGRVGALRGSTVNCTMTSWQSRAGTSLSRS